MRRNFRFDGLAQMRFEYGACSFRANTHQVAILSDVDREDGSKPLFHTRLGLSPIQISR
jgi:hypothetical protein